MRLVIALLAGFVTGQASADTRSGLHDEFTRLFVKVECQTADDGNFFNEPYARCHEAPEVMLRTMDQAYRMRLSCPHPLSYAVFVQMAFDCSSEHRHLAGATGQDVGRCFEARFVEKFDPASRHYCNPIEEESWK